MTVPAEAVYTVQVDQEAARVLRKLDRPVQARIAAAFDSLAVNPRPGNVIAVTGHPGLLRIRVGDYRIIYTVKDAVLIVLVLDIGHRGEIYRNY